MYDGLVGIVAKYGGLVNDKEVEEVYQHCLRKMEVNDISNAEEYLSRLFDDELRHSILMNCINGATALII